MGRRSVLIQPRFLQEMSTVGNVMNEKCIEGLPPDAVLIKCGIRNWLGEPCIHLIFEHSDWEESILSLDANIPELSVVFRTREKAKMLAYKDRGLIRKVAFAQGYVSTDWRCDGEVHTGVFVNPLKYEVEELC